MSTTLVAAPDHRRRNAAAALQRLLPQLVALTLQAKQAHWNVQGPAFLPLHDLTEQIALDTTAWADRVAERATALGSSVDARPNRVAAAAHGDLPGGWLRDTEVIASLGDRIVAVADTVRAGLAHLDDDDVVAHDIHVDVLEGLEKYGWLLRSTVA